MIIMGAPLLDHYVSIIIDKKTVFMNLNKKDQICTESVLLHFYMIRTSTEHLQLITNLSTFRGNSVNLNLFSAF